MAVGATTLPELLEAEVPLDEPLLVGKPLLLEAIAPLLPVEACPEEPLDAVAELDEPPLLPLHPALNTRSPAMPTDRSVTLTRTSSAAWGGASEQRKNSMLQGPSPLRADNLPELELFCVKVAQLIRRWGGFHSALRAEP